MKMDWCRLHPITAAIQLSRRAPMRAAAAMAMGLNVAWAQEDVQTQIADATQLPEVDVTSAPYESGYKADRSTIGGKVPAALRDIPQTVTVVNRTLLDAQNATSLTDALRNVPGITLGAGEGGQIGDNVNLRGFTARTDVYLDGMRDRGQYRRDTFALDSVEVLKGPSSLFFGRGSTGGVINQVSKTPVQKEKNQITAALGSDGYYRTTVDINQPLSDGAAYRVAVMAQDIDSTRDVVNNRDWGIAPSLRSVLNADTDLRLSALVQHNRDIPDYGQPFFEGRPAPVSHDRFYGDTDDYFNQDVYVAKMRLDHRINSALSLRNQLQASQTGLDARPTPYRVCTTGFDNPAGSCPTSPPGTPLDQVSVQSDRRDREIKDTSLFNQLDLLATFATGPVRHELVAGAEVGRDQTYNQGYAWTPRRTKSLGNFEPSPTDPAATRTRNATHTEGSAVTLGFYLNDMLTLSDQWKLTAGLRRDRFEADAKTVNNADGTIPTTTVPPPPGSPAGTPATTAPNAFARTDSETSVRGGVIYQPDMVQSYYVSYGTSFNPSAEAVTITAAQSAVPPEKTRSYEIGGKWELAGGALSLNSALFRVEKADARTTDPTAGNSVSLDGDTRVQGLEVGAVGHVTDDLQLIAGYTRLDSELVRTKDALVTTTGSTTSTTAVPAQGNELANTPKNSGSLWATYQFLQSFDVGGGAYYVGKRFVTNSNATSVDSYWRIDATIAWQRPVCNLQLNVQNLLDVEYFDSLVASENGRAVPGRGRTVIFSGSYSF